jgi:iron complex outermembrane recepter protein
MKFASIKTSLLVSAAAIGAFSATTAYAQSAEDDNGGLAEIIVTAQKREQSVQDVPIAVTAITQDALQANRITTINDLSSIAPGVSVRPSAGGIGVPTFTIRGQNSYGVVAGSDKQVSIYLDGVYISSPRGSIFDLPDVARLEVLRGPQGTLFGRNATAGAVSVTTRDPTGEMRVKLEGSYGNYHAYRLRASVDLPQMGPLSAYFSFMRNSKNGDIQNSSAGLVWDRSLALSGDFGKSVSPKYLGSLDSNSYFAAVKFESGDFTTVYKFDKNVDNGTPDGVAFLKFDPNFAQLGAAAPLFAPIFNAIYSANNIYLNPGNLRPEIVNNGWTVPRKQRITGHSLTSTWQASDNLTVKNIFAYRQTYVHAPSSIDGVSGLIFPATAVVPHSTFIAFSNIGRPIAAAPACGVSISQATAIAQIGCLAGVFGGAAFGGTGAGLIGSRYLLTASQATSLSKQWSDELVINYSADKLNVTVGAIWFKGDDVSGGPEGQQNTFSFGSPFIPASGLIPLGNEGRTTNTNTSLAAYAQVEYKVTPQIELVGGARITYDKKGSSFRYNAIVNGVATAPGFILPPDFTQTKPNFMVGVNWTPNDDTLVYGKYSTSFVTGGNTLGLDYRPEVAKSWELGLKADFLDRRLRTNLALFYVDYIDHQTPSSPTSLEATIAVRERFSAIFDAATVNVLVPLAGGGALSTFVQPVGNVRAKGFELEVTAAPSRGLTMGGSIAYTDTSISNIDPILLRAQNGEFVLSNRPKWTASLYGAYETQPLFGEATLSFRMDGIFRSQYLLTSKPAQDALLPQNVGIPYIINIPSHWKLNGRIALKHLSIGGASAELAVWGKNLTDRKYANSYLFLRQGSAANYDPARTFGVELGVEF